MDYLRNSAVNYAINYALHPNPYYRYFPIQENQSGDCANFISQCLLAGGASMIYNSQNQWWYNHSHSGENIHDTWSLSWSVAHSLYWLLKINYSSKASVIKGNEVTSLDLLQKGDLVFFEDKKGLIFHSAIITSHINGQPLISQHSFEALNIPVSKSYSIYKLHYLAISL